MAIQIAAPSIAEATATPIQERAFPVVARKGCFHPVVSCPMRCLPGRRERSNRARIVSSPIVLPRRTVRQGAGAMRTGSLASEPVTSTLATPPKKSVTSVSAGEIGDRSVDTPG